MSVETSLSNKNQICQWYCCLCGQSFGQIYYKADSNISLNENDSFENLKYYSQIIYKDAEMRFTSEAYVAPLESEIKTSAEIVLKIPTRFTCHRCDHMMCPYCPKIRLKDLNNEG